MKLKIDLLRHGETTLSHMLRGSTDDELTELGWQQMRQTIADASLKNQSSHISIDPSKTLLPWQMLFSSPLQRCALFAEHLVSDLKLPLIIDANLQEMHFGDWEGLSTQYIYETDPELLANFWQEPTQYSPPNAETIQAFRARIMCALQNIQQQMQLQQVEHALVVTHGGVIKLLKCLALQQPLDDVLKMSAELGQLNRFTLESDDMQLQLLESET